MLGFGILTKLAFLIPLSWALIYALYCLHQSNFSKKNLVAFFFPLLLQVILWGLFAKSAYGGFFQTGYSHHVINFSKWVWTTPLWKGIYLQLFSFDYGLFFYNPILIPIVIGLLFYWARHSPSFFEFCLFGAIISQLLFFARWSAPQGGEALGPRYLVTILPLFFIAGNRSFQLLLCRPTLKLCCSLILLFSVTLQMANSSVKIQQYWTMKKRAGVPLKDPHWVANLKIFKFKLKGNGENYHALDFGAPEQRLINLGDAPSLWGMNYWWAHALRGTQWVNCDGLDKKDCRTALLSSGS